MQVAKFIPGTTEIALSNSTANTVSSAKIVRIVNPNTTTSHVITVANTGGSNLYSFTLAPLDSLAIVKAPSDTLKVDVGSEVKAAPITFTN